MEILTQKEFASLGGKARAEKLSAKRRKEISDIANKAKLDKSAIHKSNV